MKKFLSLVLALVMTMSLVTVSAGAADFSDDSTVTYQEAVDVISAAGIVDGYEDGSFKPTDTLTRGAAAKIICNMILGPTTAEALKADTAPFSDVPTTNTFAGYITYCSQQGIISGYTDGTFRPGNTLTGYAFMKMLLGALGYDQDIEGFTGPNWSVQVGKVALGIDLDEGFDGTFNGVKAVTREEACLYAFNTMKATMVEYDSKTSVEIEGTKVNVGNDDAKDMENNTSSDGNIDDDGLMQFAEKYHTDLKKSKSNTTDDFGRPAAEWKFKANTIGTYVDTSLLQATYTEAVEAGELYDLIGKNTVDDIKDRDGAYVETYVDGIDGGYTVNNLFVKSSTADAGASGRGVLTEVYVDDEYGKDEDETMVTIVFINTYLVQATSDYNDAKEELSIDYIDDNDSTRPTSFPNKIEQDDFDVSDCKEDDYLLVTYSVDAKEIKSVEAAEMLSGEVDTYKERDSITVDGTKYKYNAIVGDNGKDETFSVGDSCTLVLDKYGFILYVDEANASGNYVYLQRVARANGLDKNALGAAYFTDGTYKEISIKKITTNATGELTNAGTIDSREDDLRGWYTYSVNSSDEYTLKSVDTAIKNTKYTNTVEKFTTSGQIVDNEKVRFLDGSTIMGNNETVFLVLDSDDDVDVYTGLTNAPDISLSSKTTSGNPAYVGYIEKDNGYATYVFVDLNNDDDAKVDDAASDDYMFVLQSSNKRINLSNDKSYYEYDVIREGEVTTALINDGDEGEFEEGKLYNKIKSNSDEYLTGGDEIGGDTDEARGLNQDSRTAPIEHSKGTLKLGGKEYILSEDADINLAVAGTSANKDLLKDEDADFETYLGISGNSLAGYLKGYDVTYDYYAVLDDDYSDIVNVLYVWVTKAVENDSTGGSTSGSDGDVEYTASVASSGRTSIALTYTRPDYVPASATVTMDVDVLADGAYVETANVTIPANSSSATVRCVYTYETDEKITIETSDIEFSAVKVQYVDENGKDITGQLKSGYTSTLSTTAAESISFQVDTVDNINLTIESIKGTTSDLTTATTFPSNAAKTCTARMAKGDQAVVVTISGLDQLNSDLVTVTGISGQPVATGVTLDVTPSRTVVDATTNNQVMLTVKTTGTIANTEAAGVKITLSTGDEFYLANNSTALNKTVNITVTADTTITATVTTAAAPTVASVRINDADGNGKISVNDVIEVTFSETVQSAETGWTVTSGSNVVTKAITSSDIDATDGNLKTGVTLTDVVSAVTGVENIKTITITSTSDDPTTVTWTQA